VTGSPVVFVAGALLGLSLAVPPGPMNAIIAETTVSSGWGAGVAAGVGAMAADACFFALAAVGVAAAVRRVPVLRAGLLAVGGVVLLYFAYRAARQAATGGDGETAATGFTAAFAVAITNPSQITWWLTAGVALLDPGTIEVVGHRLPTGGPLAVLGFFGGNSVGNGVSRRAVAFRPLPRTRPGCRVRERAPAGRVRVAFLAAAL